MNPKITKEYICASISAFLIDFGYPDATPDKMAAIYDAFKAGKRWPDLPHGVLGGFAERQLEEIVDLFKEELP